MTHQSVLQAQVQVQSSPSTGDGILQRRCACGQHTGVSGECAECRKKRQANMLQRAATDSAATGDVPPIVHEVLRSPGQPLDAATRAFMEPRFGHDFSAVPSHIAPQGKLTVNQPGDRFEQEADRTAQQVTSSAALPSSEGGYDFSQVRVHTDARAAESARAVNALAYTVGQHVVFGAEQYEPGTAQGRRVLAHELAHVVQQSNGSKENTVQRWAIKQCTPSQRYAIEDAIAKAFADLTAVQKLLNRTPVSTDINNALWLAFRDDSPKTLERVRDDIGQLKNKLTSSRIICDDKGCEEDEWGFVENEIIHICAPKFFELKKVDGQPQKTSKTGKKFSGLADRSREQSHTLIHEAAHLYLHKKDRGYFDLEACRETDSTPRKKIPKRWSVEAASGTKGDDPITRLDNADSYPCFVFLLLYLPKGDADRSDIKAETLDARAQAYRGETLSIEPQDTDRRRINGEITIFTQTTNSMRSLFTITRIPENSGFRFRWKLITAKHEFKLDSPNHSDTSSFDEDNKAVFISNQVRSSFGPADMGAATIRCDIQLYRPSSDKVVPPVVTRTIEISIAQGQE
jgi:hypothetical protein